jgi:glutaminase
MRGLAASARPSRIASPIQHYLERMHDKYAALQDGEVATYIPELAKADPAWFAICLATTDGHVYEVGDSRQPFTIQSISKPFTYGLALEDRGRGAVLDKIGVEPSGEAFNSISLAPGTGCPLNPMINAGAIASTSLIAGHSPEDKLDRLLGVFGLYAGRALALDWTVFESERDTGHRNRAIGHMLRNFGVLGEDPTEALDLYFQQCSIAVDCRDLSVMAATLANGGINPLTSERAVRGELVESMLSVMTTCGMYDYAGEWVYAVGMPAKSGVAGGILAVLPGQLGIGVFSPRLDARGNSVRGVAVCKDISRDFNLHFLRVARSSRSAIRAQYDVAAVSSKRRRSERERRLLDDVGKRARVYELQGDLSFSAVEAVVRNLVEASARMDLAILDLKRVTHVDQAAAEILVDLVLRFGHGGRMSLFVHAQSHPKFLRFLEESLTTPEERARLLTFPDLDPALEWCENQLIGALEPGVAQAAAISLAEHALCRGLSAEALECLGGFLERRQFRPGQFLIRRGDAADAIYLLVAGEVSVTVPLPSGQLKRLATFSAGMTIGENAAVERGVRSADVRADTNVECFVLPAAALDTLGAEHPQIKARLLENLLQNLSRIVARLNQEVAALAG